MTAPAARVQEQFDDAAQQRAAATLGLWAFLATEILFFGVLFAAYTVCRVSWPDAFISGSGHTDLFLGSIETGVLLVSSFTVAIAVRDIQLGGRRIAMWLLTATAALGVAFIVLHGVEYRADYLHGVIPGVRYDETGPLAGPKQLFFILYYITTLFHGLHVTVGVILLLVMARRVRRGDFDAEHHNALETSALYWHLVDIVWIFVFPLYYLVGRA